MSAYRVGFIGTGKRLEKKGPWGYAMAYSHAEAYKQLAGDCELVACADIVLENAKAFAEFTGTPAVYTDYNEMLAKERLDIVSICTWPHLHTQMVIDCARAGVRAIHCEKPMSDTWEGARLMAQECERRGVRLTFNHQRRFGKPFRLAKKLLDEGAVGALLRVECAVPNMYDYGTHSVDMCNYFNNETLADWVIAQIDYRQETRVFGAHCENQVLALWRYRNGVMGLAAGGPGGALVGAHNKIVGTEGVIEVGPTEKGAPVLRVRRNGSTKWESIDCAGEGLHGPGYIERAIADVVKALKAGGESELCARNALNATEIIFAAYESSRRRGRVDLPLLIRDNPLAAMVESGELKPKPASA